MPVKAQLPSGIKSIKELDISGKTVFLRLDFNVPLSEPDEEGVRHVGDDNRIREALPTLRYCQDHGSKIIIASHLGRPDGRTLPEFSLEPVAAYLAGLLEQEVTLADDCVGEGIELMALGLKPGQILMLENLRFHAEEEANDPGFSTQLAKLAQVYVTDAFGTAHRKHASTFGVPSLMQHKGAGLLIEKELTVLETLLNHPEKPFLAVLGGAKVTDKIATIDSLMRKVQGIAIGGLMAHAFWVAQKKALPEKAKEPSAREVEAAREVLKSAKARDIAITLPTDSNEGFDIGPKTIEIFSNLVTQAKTIFWNGPVGWFENPPYNEGTFQLARAMGATRAFKVAGGGDTVSAIKAAGCAAEFDHLSTGGGAVLEYLEGNGLPGIEVLRNYEKKPPKPALEPEDFPDDDRGGF